MNKANESTIPATHPSGDERYSTIDQTIKRFNSEKDALLEVLNSAQETFGYLSRDLLVYISTHLSVPLSQVYGVATFYHMFTFTPLGVNNCIVCTGTACHVKGSDNIVQQLLKDHNLQIGETTPDGLLSVTTARCLGSCGLAPVVVINGQVSGKETPDSVLRKVTEVVSHSTARLELERE